MDDFEGGTSLPGTATSLDMQNPTGGAVFDASQYAFFGNNDAVEEVELGGLEEEDDFHPVGFEDEDIQLEREEVEVLDSLSEIDDLASTFSKLNKVVSTPGAAGVFGSKVPGESSSGVEWAQRLGFPNWSDHQLINSDSSSMQDGKRWSSQPETKLLYRTSSHPKPQQQYPNQHFPSDPIRVPNTPFPPYPHLPHHPSGNQIPLSSPNISSLPNHQFQLSSLPEGSQFTGNLPRFITPHTANHLPRNQWTGQSNMLLGKRSNSYNDLLHQQLMSPQLMQNRPNHPFQQPYSNLPGTQSPIYNHHIPPPMNRVEGVLGLGDLRDQRTRSLPKIGQGYRYPQPFDNRSGWPQFRSKYMSSDEIENILRMQLAATHSNDPYIDDYYHQARLAKKNSGVKLKHHFCPNHLRDLPPHGRASSEPHAYLQVDALGRVAFPSIRRPRPLLEVDPPNSSVSAEHNLSEKPLEQEPLLAARVAIEDGLCLLLDVDDIDRFLRFNQPQDGGAHLMNRRQALLDELAASLQLTDPLVNSAVDDLVFLRVVSLPKGRKLLSKYLLLLAPNGELIRVVSMAIFRNLRFLFGNPVTSSDLVQNVSFCVAKMDLKALSACLASVACSSEHPPLRPIGSPAGDGASMILKSVLERATEIFTNPNESGNCTGLNRTFWQGSFDSFFVLLTKYCFNKYDTIIQSYTYDMGVIGPDAARAISREMPIELLRASLPHTNENQKKVLIDFARRSMPVNNGE